MKKLLIAMLASLSICAVAEESAPIPDDAVSTCLQSAGDDKVAASGCCSHNGGICSCYAGKLICCNGSWSNCPCAKEDENPTVTN